MQMVTLTRDMRPWRKGQDAVLPEEMVKRLLANEDKHPDGPAVTDPRPFPPADVAPKTRVAAPIPPSKGRFMTRKRG